MPFNGNSIPLNQAFGGLPNVSEALFGWMLPMVFGVVTKITQNGRVYETVIQTSFQGVWQPLSDEALKLKEEGQRSWKWFRVHALPGLNLATDSTVIYNSVQFRVMQKWDWPEYGYVEYHLVQDYTGAGPTDVTPPVTP